MMVTLKLLIGWDALYIKKYKLSCCLGQNKSSYSIGKKANVIDVPKGSTSAPGSLNTGSMSPGGIYTR